MSIDLSEGLLLKAFPEVSSEVEETTVSGASSTGVRRIWPLILPDGTELPVWDTAWDREGREVVMGVPEEVPEIPRPLERLLGRRRASVESVPRRRMLYMTIYLVFPNLQGWPTFKKKLSREDLLYACGPDMIDGLHDHGLVSIGTKEELLGAEGKSRLELCALLEPDREVAPVATYVVTRVVPILRSSGVLRA
ncbi:hypothetical protein [Microbispora rosea]|uniref:hypothetical protein n=1 Tax=Microbispora rosea TaxID=58117 RepID=UPI003D909557